MGNPCGDFKMVNNDRAVSPVVHVYGIISNITDSKQAAIKTGRWPVVFFDVNGIDEPQQYHIMVSCCMPLIKPQLFRCYIWLRICRYSLQVWSRFNIIALQWRHNGRDGVSNQQPHDCLLNCLFRRRSKKISKLRLTGLCAWNSPVTGEFPA